MNISGKHSIHISQEVSLAVEGLSHLRAWFPTGSWFTVDDPNTPPKDFDYLVLVSDFDKSVWELKRDGWKTCNDNDSVIGAYNDEQQFGVEWTALRKGDDNLIVSADVSFYLRSVGATLIAKELNILSKQDRIGLFRQIKWDEDYQHPRLPCLFN